MKKFLVGVLTAAMLAVGGSVAVADDYVADATERSDGHGKCQEVGDPHAGDNDDNGLSTAAETGTSVIRPIVQGDECDNSGGRRGGGD